MKLLFCFVTGNPAQGLVLARQAMSCYTLIPKFVFTVVIK